MSDYSLRGLIPTLLGAGAAAGLAMAGGALGAAHLFNKAADPVVSISPGRQQLMKEGFVGTQDQLKRFMSAQVDEYFKMNGYPCDPKAASAELATTVARAKCTASVPK